MAVGVTCWRCEQPGHVAAECQRPPAGTRPELYQRIDRYVERMITGEITRQQKRDWVKAETREFEKARAA